MSLGVYHRQVLFLWTSWQVNLLGHVFSDCIRCTVESLQGRKPTGNWSLWVRYSAAQHTLSDWVSIATHMKPNHSSTSFCSTKALSQSGCSEGEWSGLGVKSVQRSSLLFELPEQRWFWTLGVLIHPCCLGPCYSIEFPDLRVNFSAREVLSKKLLRLPDTQVNPICSLLRYGSPGEPDLFSPPLWSPGSPLATSSLWWDETMWTLLRSSQAISFISHHALLRRTHHNGWVKHQDPYLQFSCSGIRKLGKPPLL